MEPDEPKPDETGESKDDPSKRQFKINLRYTIIIPNSDKTVPKEAYSVSFSPDDSQIAVACKDGSICIFSVFNQKLVIALNSGS
jgi:WD40 repeat protein